MWILFYLQSPGSSYYINPCIVCLRYNPTLVFCSQTFYWNRRLQTNYPSSKCFCEYVIYRHGLVPCFCLFGSFAHPECSILCLYDVEFLFCIDFGCEVSIQGIPLRNFCLHHVPLGRETFLRLVLICLPRDHEKVFCRRDITGIMLKTVQTAYLQ